MSWIDYYRKRNEYEQTKLQGLRVYSQLLNMYHPEVDAPIEQMRELIEEANGINERSLKLKEELMELHAKITSPIMKGETIWN